MHSARVFQLAALVCAALPQVVCTSLTGQGQRFVSIQQKSSQVEIILDWSHAANVENVRVTPSLVRITDRTTVSYTVKNFNFLRFGLQQSIQQDTVAAYATIVNLWSEILGLRIPPGAIPLGASDFNSKLGAWVDKIDEVSHQIDKFLDSYTTIGLTNTQVDSIRSGMADFDQRAREELRQARSEVRRAAQDAGDINRIALWEGDHASVLRAIDTLVVLGGLSVNGMSKSIGTKGAGVVVTLKLSPIPRGSSADTLSPKVVSYFVETTLPLTAHVGLAFSSLDNVDFSAIRTAAGQDLFARITDNKSTQDLVLFGSLRLFRFKAETPVELALTLGAPVAKPNERIYAGGSIRIGRVSLTFGGTSGLVNTAGSQVVDSIAQGLGVRQLYSTFTSARKWGVFFAGSFVILGKD